MENPWIMNSQRSFTSLTAEVHSYLLVCCCLNHFEYGKLTLFLETSFYLEREFPFSTYMKSASHFWSQWNESAGIWRREPHPLPMSWSLHTNSPSQSSECVTLCPPVHSECSHISLLSRWRGTHHSHSHMFRHLLPVWCCIYFYHFGFQF